MDEINEQDYKAKILEIYRDYYDKLPSGAIPKKAKQSPISWERDMNMKDI